MKQTTLDLNGPILSFVQHPQSTDSCSGGSATFVAIATATFPTQIPVNPAENTGSLSYRWYAGDQQLSDGTYLGATISGAGTTELTITNPVSPSIKSLNIYAGVDYVPSAYSQPYGFAVTAGTAKSTGNAINEILTSDSATLTVYPAISITTQPQNIIVDEETTATFSVTSNLSDTTQGSLSYQWLLNGQELVNGSDTIGTGSVVSGATTPNLSILYPFVGIYDIQVRITHPISCDSPVLSDVAEFSVVPVSINITTEVITSSSSTATVETYNLLTSNNVTLLAENYPNSTSLISMFAPQKDVNVEMEIYGGKGSNIGSYVGGEGGYSKIRFQMLKGEEYIIAGLNSVENNPFIYRKSALIAVCGKGGDAGSGGNGGRGGGIGISGQNGGGSGGGSGGQAVLAGQLSSTGIFGSLSSSTPRSPDTKATIPNAGRTIPCTKGEYWTNRGFSACADVGTSKFFYGTTEITNTSSITRGFKQGYDIRQTSGRGVSPTTGTQNVPSTCYRNVSRTCTRNVPRTCTRTVSGNVTKSTRFIHYFNNVNYTTNSFTSSGDPMSGTVLGAPPPETRRYDINASGLGLNSTGYSVSVTNTSQSAAGDFPGIIFERYQKIGDNYSFTLYFKNASNNASTFARDFTVTVNGTANVSESYDCSYTETYDCSYTESYDCSYTETFTISGGGNGGSGAVGGTGGGSGAAGGGGSGYTDGSVTVVESTLGGNNGTAKVIIRTTDI